jgi:protein-tyrosine phosphatase
MMKTRNSNEQRRVQGAPNFRDLGGLPTTDGGLTRSGLLFRSGGLEELTGEDIDYLVTDVGLRTVLDLRSADDNEPAEGLANTSVRVLNLPVIREGSSTSLKRPMGPDGRVDVPYVYQMFMEMSIGSIQTIFAELAGGATPAVFHCVAGKDRTGVVAALILRAVGVTREAVISDFMASEPALDEIFAYMRRRPAYTDVVAKLPPGTMDAEPKYMGNFLDFVDTRYGGIREWLTGPAGVPADTLAALEDILTETPDKE